MKHTPTLSERSSSPHKPFGRARLLARAAVLGLAMLAINAGCARSYITPVGPQHFQPQMDNATFYVLDRESDIAGPYILVGEINFRSPGKYEELQERDAIPELTKQARQLGANCIIIDQRIEIRQGLVQVGLAIKGRAVRLMQD
jgi:hypothetical protein